MERSDSGVKNAAITGTVLGGSGIYIPCSTVKLVNTGSKESQVKVTDGWPSTNEKFEFTDLEAGTYELSVISMVGFTPMIVNLKEGEKIDIRLRIKNMEVSSKFKRPEILTMDALKDLSSEGVSVVEVNDYVFGNYEGELKFPPNADANPRKAFIIFWKDFAHRFIFAHECSYCPIIELPSGAGVCYQFFEGNEGKAELFNTPGRRERNTYVEIMENTKDRVWLRWTYFGVNQHTGDQYYRGVEDFWAYPNGFIVRRQTYSSLIDNIHGHSREPIENIGMCPVGKTWVDVLRKNDETGEHHALVVLDTYSRNRYDVFWKHQAGTIYTATPRREGSSWAKLDNAEGVAIILPMKEGSPFCVFGDASGFRHDFTRLKDHSYIETGGVGWIGQSWDHWPIGWLNSQGHEVDKDSLKKYPNHFSPAGMDFFALPNEEAESGMYYSLIGVGGGDVEMIRDIGAKWLSMNKGLAEPEKLINAAKLPPIHQSR